MADTFYQIYYPIVFAVKHRQALIPREHKEDLHPYITALVQKRGAKMYAIHGMPDHVHILISGYPTLMLSDLVKAVKVESNPFINSKPWSNKHFSWQAGYGAFTYSHSHVPGVINYIKNRRPIIKNKHSKTNTSSFYKNSKSPTMIDICLIFMNISHCNDIEPPVSPAAIDRKPRWG